MPQISSNRIMKEEKSKNNHNRHIRDSNVSGCEKFVWFSKHDNFKNKHLGTIINLI